MQSCKQAPSRPIQWKVVYFQVTSNQDSGPSPPGTSWNYNSRVHTEIESLWNTLLLPGHLESQDQGHHWCYMGVADPNINTALYRSKVTAKFADRHKDNLTDRPITLDASDHSVQGLKLFRTFWQVGPKWKQTRNQSDIHLYTSIKSELQNSSVADPWAALLPLLGT